MTHDPYSLPSDLPIPQDDGAADDLVGSMVPSITLPSSRGSVDLAEFCEERALVYVYPRTGTPRLAPPDGWNSIPGARGCTPESCAFRDRAADFGAFGMRVAGLSAQSLDEQIAFAERTHMPFPVIADDGLRLREALQLPVFEITNLTFYRRLTFIAEARRIVTVFYPVFPPDRHAEEVVEYIATPPRLRKKTPWIHTDRPDSP